MVVPSPTPPHADVFLKLRLSGLGPGPEVYDVPPPPGLAPGHARRRPLGSPPPPRRSAAPACASPCASSLSVPPARSVWYPFTIRQFPASPTTFPGTPECGERRPHSNSARTARATSPCLAPSRPSPCYAQRRRPPHPPGPAAPPPTATVAVLRRLPEAAAGADRRTRPTRHVWPSVTDRSSWSRVPDHRRGAMSSGGDALAAVTRLHEDTVEDVARRAA